MKRKGQIVAFFLLWLCINWLAAQENHYRFEKFPSDVILSHTSITSVIQDHHGFLWLGTWSGLIKYDGYQVRQYKQEPGNVNGLEGNKITTLFEDRDGQLWVGARSSGLYRYNRRLDRFIQYKHDPSRKNSLSNNNVWAIFEDSFGYLWVGTEKGLNLFDSETGDFIHFKHRPDDNLSLSFDFVYTIVESPDHSLWIGTERGLNQLVRNARGEPLYFIRHSLAPSHITVENDIYLSHNYIYKIKAVLNEPQSLWIGTKAGLKKVRFSKEANEKLDVVTYQHKDEDPFSLSHSFVPDMWERSNGQLWVATFNGLNLLNPETGEFRRFLANSQQPETLSNHFIRTLFCDRSDILWIGTDGGLQKLNLSAKPFLTIQPAPSGNASNSIVTTVINGSGDNGLWVGARGGGLNYLPLLRDGRSVGALRQFSFAVPRSDETAGFISDLALDEDGWLWATTLGSGVIRVRESELLSGGPVVHNLLQTSEAHGLDYLNSEHLMAVTTTASGDVWIGSWDLGLIRYDRQKDQFYGFRTTTDQSLSLDAFPNVHLLEQKETNEQTLLWVGTRGGGLLKLTYDRLKDELILTDHFAYKSDRPNGITNNYINCLYLDRNHHLWIGTENGLNRLDLQTNSFIHILEKDGLVNGIVQSVIEDREGNLWVSTQKGISCLRQKMDESGFTIKNFDAYDGLQDNFFSDDAACITGSGHLVFGGIKGLSYFFPPAIQPDTVAPMIALSDFRLYNKTVPVGKMEDGRMLLRRNIAETRQIDLTHRDKVISFEFVGLHFVDPKKIQYAHMLEGFDPDWVYTSAGQRIAHYTNLHYDEFTFKVKAANGDGRWSDPISLQLKVRPPFWHTTSAYVLYLLLFATLLWGVWKITKSQTELKHKLQLERVEREKLEEVNQMKLRFFTNLSHELRTPLTLIMSPLEHLIKERSADKKLYRTFTMMHQNANRLLTMINQLLDIRKSEAGLMKLKVAEGNIVKFVQEVILSFKGLARQQRIDLTFTPATEHISLWYDRDQLEKVLFNLLANAFKFTPENGSIQVSVSRQFPHQPSAAPGYVLITVKDTGSGIPEAQLEHIFDRFYQVEKYPETDRKGGTGIGLALAKSIVEAHHGKIRVESTPGHGASFHVLLPLGEAHFSEDEKINGFLDSEHLTHYVPPGDPLEDSQPPLRPEEEEKKTREKDTLLLVEDNADIRIYLKEQLEAQYRIEEAADGREGLEKALTVLPDLIIADISMPHMDGIEMCARIKSDIHTSHIPVILLTARTSLLYKIDGLETGADDYITKPFNILLLTTRIKNLIESRRRLQEKFANNFDLSPTGIVMNALDEQFLSQVKLLIEKHMDDSNFSTEQLAASMHMSRMQLYRKLKVLTGKSPNQVIRSIRLQRAAQLLETHQYNVSDVTYMVGYNDLKWFREQFKKEYGVSPSEYEKKDE